MLLSTTVELRRVDDGARGFARGNVNCSRRGTGRSRSSSRQADMEAPQQEPQQEPQQPHDAADPTTIPADHFQHPAGAHGSEDLANGVDAPAALASDSPAPASSEATGTEPSSEAVAVETAPVPEELTASGDAAASATAEEAGHGEKQSEQQECESTAVPDADAAAAAAADAAAVAPPVPKPPPEGPVLTMVSKRLRALRKKLNRITSIEEGRSKGKPINKEQEEVLRSKPSVVVLIDEYEKLRQPLQAAVREEVGECVERSVAEALRRHEEQQQQQQQILLQQQQAAAAVAGAGAAGPASGYRVAGHVDGGRDAQGNAGSAESSAPGELRFGENAHIQLPFSEADLQCLVQLLYFSLLFELRDPNHAQLIRWRNEQERNSCLSYDPVTDEDEEEVEKGEEAAREQAKAAAAGQVGSSNGGSKSSFLSEGDLNAIAALGRLITSRPSSVGGSLASGEALDAAEAAVAGGAKNHKEAVGQCVMHARKLMANSSEIVDASLGVSYAHLRERLKRIISSGFFTKWAQDVNPHVAAAAAMAAAAARAADGSSSFHLGPAVDQAQQPPQQMGTVVGVPAVGVPVQAATAPSATALATPASVDQEYLQQQQPQGAQGADPVPPAAAGGMQELLGAPFAPQAGFLLDLQQQSHALPAQQSQAAYGAEAALQQDQQQQPDPQQSTASTLLTGLQGGVFGPEVAAPDAAATAIGIAPGHPAAGPLLQAVGEPPQTLATGSQQPLMPAMQAHSPASAAAAASQQPVALAPGTLAPASVHSGPVQQQNSTPQYLQPPQRQQQLQQPHAQIPQQHLSGSSPAAGTSGASGGYPRGGGRGGQYYGGRGGRGGYRGGRGGRGAGRGLYMGGGGGAGGMVANATQPAAVGPTYGHQGSATAGGLAGAPASQAPSGGGATVFGASAVGGGYSGIMGGGAMGGGGMGGGGRRGGSRGGRGSGGRGRGRYGGAPGGGRGDAAAVGGGAAAPAHAAAS